MTELPDDFFKSLIQLPLRPELRYATIHEVTKNHVVLVADGFRIAVDVEEHSFSYVYEGVRYRNDIQLHPVGTRIYWDKDNKFVGFAHPVYLRPEIPKPLPDVNPLVAYHTGAPRTPV